MTENIRGNFIDISWQSNELSDKTYTYTLPNGYSVQEMLVILLANINEIESALPARNNYLYTFPVVSGNSPCRFRFRFEDVTKFSYIRILITKFGQKPDIHYFDRAFEPILVTGKDGEEYNMIPSDQFK